MKTGIALFCLIGLSLIFDVDKLWPKSADIKSSDYNHIALTETDTVKAIENYRRNLYLNEIGFYKKFFPLSEQKLTDKTYVYFIIAKVILIVMAFFWWKEASEYSEPYVFMFLFFLSGDLVDFLIIYNENYSPYLSYNILFTGLYGIFLIFMAWRHR